MSSRRGRNIRRCVAAVTTFVIGITVCAPTRWPGRRSQYPTVPPRRRCTDTRRDRRSATEPRPAGPTTCPRRRRGRTCGCPATLLRSRTWHRPRWRPGSSCRPGRRRPRPAMSSPTTATAQGTASASRTAHRVGQRATAATVADNASYSVAATYDTVPMANQTGRVAVTLTNTGTATWSGGFGLGANVYASSNTTGTGTPLTTGQDVTFQSHRRSRPVGDGGERDAEREPRHVRRSAGTWRPRPARTSPRTAAARTARRTRQAVRGPGQRAVAAARHLREHPDTAAERVRHGPRRVPGQAGSSGSRSRSSPRPRTARGRSCSPRAGSRTTAIPGPCRSR